MSEQKFMTCEEKIKALTACQKRLRRIKSEASIPSYFEIEHAINNIELAKQMIQSDQEAWDRVCPKEIQT